MIFEFANFAETWLTQPVAADATVLPIASVGQGAFPPLELEASRFAIVIFDGKQPPEIVYVSEQQEGAFTVERGREGTQARTWSAGAAVTQTLTAGTIKWFVTGGQDEWITILQDGIGEVDARVTQEASARADADAALAQSILTTNARVGENESAVQVTQQSFADLSAAWGTFQTEVSAASNTATSNATQALNASVENGTALASLETFVETAVGDNAAAFAERIEGFTDFDEAQVLVNTSVDAELGEIGSSLETEITVRTTQFETLSSRADALESDFGSLDARLDTEEITRANADFALAERTTKLEAEVEGARGGSTDLTARLTEIESTAATATSAVASRTTTLEAQMDTTGPSGLLSRLETEETARADGDGALAARATTLEAQFATSTGSTLLSRLATEETTRATEDEVLAERIDTLEVDFELTNEQVAALFASDEELEGDVAAIVADLLDIGDELVSLNASITSEASARATADGILATRTSTVEAMLDTTTWSALLGRVETTEGVIAGAGGLDAWWDVTTIAGSAMAAIRARATSAGGSAIGMIADAIALYNVIEEVAEEVLTAVGGNVYVKKALIVGDSTYYVVIDPAVPRLSVYGPSVNLHIGAPVGLSNDFILWFGANTVEWDEATTANCYFGLGTDGNIKKGNGRLQIDTADITDLAVDTIKIKNAAVTNEVTASSSSQLSLGSGSSRATVQNLTITTGGARCVIFGNFYLWAQHNDSNFTCTIVVERYSGSTVDVFSATITAPPISGDDYIIGWQTIQFTDTPPAGTHAYYMRVVFTNPNFLDLYASNRFLSVQEFKK